MTDTITSPVRRRPPMPARLRLRAADCASGTVHIAVFGSARASPPECYAVVHIDRFRNSEAIDCFPTLDEAMTAGLAEARRRRCLFAPAWEVSP